LNALYLPDYGWYRVDARGNKPGVAAEFCPPTEKLAFRDCKEFCVTAF
jgi:transglutaminase-like putative cysteine protease